MASETMKSLLNKMTLDEKIDQLIQLATFFYKGAQFEGEITGPMDDLGITEEVIQNSGSVLGASGAKEVIGIQKAHLEENRLKIPLLIMADIVHGYKTIFPVPLAIGCSWDMALAEKSAEVAAHEAAVSGVHVTFAPMVDLVRDPRWGRVMESTGEDSYLNSEFARAFVRGFQGDDLTNDTKRVAACVKHFAAYGAPEGGRDYNTVDMSERQLRETYLPAYQAALEEGCEMVMTAFNTVDGIPASGNKQLMRHLLRDEWGFAGVIISDWGAIKEMIPHGIAEDAAEAAFKGIEAGVDIDMMTSTYVNHLKQLVEDGIVNEARIDESVLRILQLKDKLGLFENPYRGANEQLETEVVFSKENRQVAYELAAKSCVLLKNEHVLPLTNDKKVALIGPYAENDDILGPWSWKGQRQDAVKLVDGLRVKINSDRLTVAKGCEIDSYTEESLQEAVKIAETSDVIVLALGESSNMSGEGNCRANIQLPAAQLQLIKTLKKLNKPTVTVLFNGRPLDLHGVIDEVDAVLEAWYPGSEGGTAITDILYGDVNPSGRLAMSFPYSVGQVPVYYNHFNTGRPLNPAHPEQEYVSKYIDIPNKPLLPFGFGLSYTTFEYDALHVSTEAFTADQSLTVTVQVKNTGTVTGDETVQLYIEDKVGEVVRPVKELKAFKKVTLEPGETKAVEFTITEQDLKYYHADLSYTSDPGQFNIYVGPNSESVLEQSFELLRNH